MSNVANPFSVYLNDIERYLLPLSLDFLQKEESTSASLRMQVRQCYKYYKFTNFVITKIIVISNLLISGEI